MAERTVFVSLRAKVDGYTSGLNKAAKSTDAFAKKAKDAQRQAETWNKVGLAGAALGAGVALLVKRSIDAASNLSETVAKTGTIFGKSADQIESFGDTAAQQLGMSKRAAMDAASTFAVFGKSAGLAGNDLVGFSTQLIGLAADLASFYNTSPEDAILAIGAALRGESEPIRQYGVLLDDATLKARALSMGIYEGTGSLTQQQRVLAAQAEILAQTSDAQGDVARTADGLANTQRRLTAEWENAQAGMGEALLPAATQVAETFGGMLRTFNTLPPELKSATLGFGALVAVLMMATPRIIATKAAMDAAGISAGVLGKNLARGVGAAALLALGVAAVNSKGDLDELTSAAERLNDALGGPEAEERAAGLGTLDAQIAALRDKVSDLQSLDSPWDFLGDLPAYIATGVQALTGGGNAADNMTAALDALQAKSDTLTQAVGAAGLVLGATNDEIRAMAIAAGVDLSGSVEDVTTRIIDAGIAAGMTGHQMAGLTTATQNAGFAANAAAEAFTKLDGVLAKQDAKDAAIKAQKDLAAALAKNGGALRGNSDAALENRAALRQAIATSAEYAASIKDPAKQAEYLTGRINDIRDALKDADTPKGEIRNVLAPLREVRDAAQDAADAANNTADGLARIPGSYTAIVTIQKKLDSLFAGGGRVRGPGSSTSDSIPAWLSNGEYVINAAAVDRYGEDFFDAANAMRLAPGGSVSDEQRKARRQARRDSRRSTSEARFQTSLFGLSDVDAALATLKREQDRLAKLRKGTVAWFQQKAVVEQAREGLRVARKQAGADALADQATADADALAKANAAIDEQKSKVEQLTQAWSQQVDAVQSALASQSQLSFDFDAQRKAVDDVTAAEQELLDARRAANMAAGPDRAAALDRVRAAEDDLASARAKAKAAEPTFDNIYAGFQQKMQALAAFRSNIETLAKRGIHSSILQQLISQGMNGGAEMAAALVKFTPEQLGAINATQSQIEADANAIGQISGNAMYGAQIMDAGQQLIQISGGQPIQLNLDTRQVYAGLLELARQQGGTLSWTAA